MEIPIPPPALAGVVIPDAAQLGGGRFLLSDAVNGVASGSVPDSVFLNATEFTSAAESIGITNPLGITDSEIVADFEVRTMPGEQSIPLVIQLPQRIAVNGAASLFLSDSIESNASNDFVYADATAAGCPALLLSDDPIIINDSAYGGEASGTSCVGIVASDGSSPLDADALADGSIRMTLIAPFNSIDCDDDPSCRDDFTISDLGVDNAPVNLDRDSGAGIGSMNASILWMFLLLLPARALFQQSVRVLGCIVRNGFLFARKIDHRACAMPFPVLFYRGLDVGARQKRS